MMNADKGTEKVPPLPPRLAKPGASLGHHLHHLQTQTSNKSATGVLNRIVPPPSSRLFLDQKQQQRINNNQSESETNGPAYLSHQTVATGNYVMASQWNTYGRINSLPASNPTQIRGYVPLPSANQFPLTRIPSNNNNQQPVNSNYGKIIPQTQPVQRQSLPAVPGKSVDNIGYWLASTPSEDRANGNPTQSFSSDLIDLGEPDEPVGSKSLLDMFDPLSQPLPASQTKKEPELKRIVHKLRRKESEPRKPELRKPEPQKTEPRNVEPRESESDMRKKPLQSDLKPKPTTTTQGLRVTYRPERAGERMVNFVEKLVTFRSRFRASEQSTNFGLVLSPTLENPATRSEASSVRLVIDSDLSASSNVTFTCSVNTTIQHVIIQTIYCLPSDAGHQELNPEHFLLKVFGLDEYLSVDLLLSDYEYVHECHKFDRDVRLTLVDERSLHRAFARDDADDEESLTISPDELLPDGIACRFASVSCLNMNISLETLDKEVNKLRALVTSQKDDGSAASIGVQRVHQALKVVCSLLGGCESLELSEATRSLTEWFTSYCQFKPKLVSGNVAESRVLPEILGGLYKKLQDALSSMIAMYSLAFPVDFHIQTIERSEKFVDIREAEESLIVQARTINCIPAEWSMKYREFILCVELWHGEHLIAKTRSAPLIISANLFQRIVIDEMLSFDDVFLSTLPREAYLHFTLLGAVQQSNPEDPEDQQLLASTSVRLFDTEAGGALLSGGQLRSLWSGEVLNLVSPSVLRLTNAVCWDKDCPLLLFTLPELPKRPRFQAMTPSSKVTDIKREMHWLDSATQTDIYYVLNRDPIAELRTDDRTLLWERRRYLPEVPSALPKVLKAAPSWSADCLPDIYSMIASWSPLTGIEALQMLLPSFPDTFVRKRAVAWIETLSSDELRDLLPQLLQAIRYEHSLTESPLLWMLFEKSMTSVRLGHHFHWLLIQNISDPLFGSTAKMILNALRRILGRRLVTVFREEALLMEKLSLANETLKATKENHRLASLMNDLDTVNELFTSETSSRLPLNPAMEVSCLEIKSCSYFTSNTLPLKLVFRVPSARFYTVDAIFKVGDDLRQDMLTMQMIAIMDKLWLKEGLDLKIITFRCLATDDRKGFVEMVKESETLRRIQTEFGSVTGSFKDHCIASWLQKHNQSELEYGQAVERFTASCAGYAVATYLLGICDRHNDNIMVTKSGHLFHIDFGKFLGDAQRVGTIKRDRVPFVLTSDMAYVINRSERPSKHFQRFVDLCCSAFNIVRRHTNLFLSLFHLMTPAGIPGVSLDAVRYVHRSLLPGVSDAEATASFNRKITESLKSRSAELNFFMHNLAQLRFTGDHGESAALSFVPRLYTRDTEDTIRSFELVDYFKRREASDKVYLFVIRIEREHQPDAGYVLRSFRECFEFYTKLSSMYPLAKFTPLYKSSSAFIGRSNTREVADRRKRELGAFFETLTQLADEIRHSTLVYTFFHPLHRDQEALKDAKFLKILNPLTPLRLSGYFGADGGVSADDEEVASPAIRRESTSGLGSQVKLSLLYKNASLLVMVMHAKNLPGARGATPPAAYVKTKLLPDPGKMSKQKTKVALRNFHPTFMEMLVYQMPLEVIRSKLLLVSVWEYDMVHENVHLGSVEIRLSEMDLLQETVSWYPLQS